MATPAISTPMVFTHEQFGNLHVRRADHRIIEINLEDAARGLGFTQTQNKGGKIYTSIRWERVKEYLAEFGYTGEVSKDAYIHYATFCKLMMKASNKAARDFGDWILNEVIPAIYRQDEAISAFYQQRGNAPSTASVTPESELDPDLLIRFATELKELRAKNAELAKTIDEKAQQLADALTKNVELEVKVDIQAKRLKDALTKNKELEATVDAQAQQLKKYEGIVEPLVTLSNAIAAYKPKGAK